MSAPPIPRDVQDFQFKLVSRFKVFNKPESLTLGSVNALAVSSKHGLIFVATPTDIQVFETACVLANPISKGSGADVEIFPRHCVPMPSQPSHIGISCDQVHVAVALAPKDVQSCAIALIYSLLSLTTNNPCPAWELRLCSSPGVQIRDLVWNPGLPQLICFCLSNSAVSVYELKGTSQTFQIFSLPETTSALCVSWSPKGKQLVIGTINGSLIQYKPDLKQVKAIPGPGNESGIVSPLSILWLSSFQFAVVYANLADNTGTSRPGLYIVNTPKGGAVTYLNYDDICYSCGDQRPLQYYLTHQQRWNVLLMSSGNSTEVGVLAADGSGGEPVTWEQWALEDASRAELPLSPSREEMYPIGMAIDTSSTTPIPWGENQSIPPAPILLLLSHHGLLCAFNILNLRPGAPHDLCSPPELIPSLREVLVNLGLPSSSPPQQPVAATQQSAPSFGALPSIGGETQGFPATSKPSLPFAPSMQPQSTLFSSPPANQTFASLGASGSTAVIGGPTQKAAADKGWLSEQGGSTFSGFGSLGTGALQPKDGLSAVPAAAPSFLYGQSTASATFPGASATTSSSFPVQSQPAPNFSFGGQALSAAPNQAAPIQPAAQPTQNFPFGPPVITKGPSAEKLVEAQQGLSISSKTKLGTASEVPQSEVSGSTLGGERLGSQQWSSSPAGVAVPKQPPSTPKPEVQSAAPAASVMQNQPQVVANTAPVVSNAAIHRAIAKETELFQKELKLLKERHQKLNIEIGSSSEKNNLVQRVEGMNNFLGELNETTQGQASEISALRTLLMEGFAWVEEAKSRQMHSKSFRYIHLAMNQDLDPVMKKYQVTIRNRIHYLDTQLQQIDNNLDNQWLQFQNSYHRKSKGRILYSGDSPDSLSSRKEIHMPSMEYVYQTILNLQQVLEQQKARLDELEAKFKDRAKWELGSSLYDASSSFGGRKRSPQKSLNYDQDLSSMAESLLAIQLNASKLEGGLSVLNCGKNPLIPKKISSRQRSQLSHLLAHRPMTRILPSPRRISSALLPITSSDSVSPVKPQMNKSSASVSSPSDFQAKSSPVRMRKDPLPAKSNILPETSMMPSTIPSQTNVSSSTFPISTKMNVPSSAPTARVSTTSNFGISSSPSFGISPASTISSTPMSSAPVINFSGPSSQKVYIEGFAAPAKGTLTANSTAPPKSASAPAFAPSAKVTVSAVSIPSTTAISSPSVTTSSTAAAQSFGAAVTSTSTSVFNMPTSTKGIPFQSSNVSLFGKSPISGATSSSEGSSWSFTAPSNFGFGSSTKAGISITGNQAVTTTTASVSSSPSVTTAASLTTSTPAFPLNFSAPTSQTGKPIFSLGTKPVTTQSSFTLPSTFGSPSTSTTLKKEPLFVFGGSFGSSTAEAPSVGTSVTEKSEKPEEKEVKQAEEEPKGKEEKSTPEVTPLVAEEKQETIEKAASTFSFASAFGNSAMAFGKSSPAVSAAITPAVPTVLSTAAPTAVSTTISTTVPTPAVTTPAATIPSPVYEDITPENKGDEVSANKGTTEEKPPPARSLFSEFNFKLSEAKSESSGEKPSIFGGSISPAVTSAPVVPSIFGSPSPTTTSLQSPVTSTTTFKSPVINQPNSPVMPKQDSTTIPNPLSSLGNIVASLGGGNFDKSTPETTNSTNTFTSFSFSLSGKDAAAKPLVPDATTAISGDSEKTPIKAFSTPTAEQTTPTTPIAGSLPPSNSDFGQGLANILGQSLPSSSAQPQQTQQPASNPFASTGGLFGSSTATTPNTPSLFGKPPEGSPSVGSFGQLMKSEGTTSIFGQSSTTPATTSGSTFEGGSIFGQAAASPSSSSIFGGGGFGSKPTFGQPLAGLGTGFSLSGSPLFGQSVGAAPNTSSIFASPSASTSAASPFQTPATASSGVFGSSSGFGSVAQTGFGSPTSSFQAKPGGLSGSTPFGVMMGASSPSFGGAPSFGSSPTFGSVFGPPSGGSTFGSAFRAQGTATSSTFENLANAETVTFGDFMKRSNAREMFRSALESPPPAFGGAASTGAPSGSSSFGGSSFTSWR